MSVGKKFALRKQERIDDLEASVAYFAAGNKAESESQTVDDLLRNLGLAFLETEIQLIPQGQDPPDIKFQDAAFEIKEILDDGRRRHAEYKALLEAARRAKTYKELWSLSDAAPGDISIADLLDEVEALSRTLVGVKYPVATTATLDLLIYYNKIQVWGLGEKPFPTTAASRLQGWRSVSVVMGHRAIVFLATATAPRFLRNVVGTVRHRPAES